MGQAVGPGSGQVELGEEAVPVIAASVAAGTPVDVVLMDVRMPGIGGLAATRQVRVAFPDVRVLLYTAFAGHLDSLARQVGAFGEVPKGVGMQELVDAILLAHRSRIGAKAPA